jgi:serine/threonine-protein phosphatase PP1 catalytic subunit
MADIHEHLLAILHRLRQAKSRKPGTLIRIPQQTLVMICQLARDVIYNESFLVYLYPPLHIIGDIHGQYYDLLRILEQCGSPPDHTYLFLGDYVDRGPQNIETMTLLLVLKILFPDHVFLLRGNHECANVNELDGFKDECVSRYSTRLWSIFNEVFDVLPFAASIGHKIFASHGGIAPDITNLAFFEKIERPIHSVTGPLFDLMCSGPDARDGGLVYGREVVHNFLERMNFEIIVRAHQMVYGGFEFPFEPDRCVVTIFSAPRGGTEMPNNGAVMNINLAFECTFTSIPPLQRRVPGARKAKSALDEILTPKGRSSRISSKL